MNKEPEICGTVSGRTLSPWRVGEYVSQMCHLTLMGGFNNKFSKTFKEETQVLNRLEQVFE